MAKARRHPSALRIFTLACAGGDDEHVKGCPDCAARADALGKVVAGVRREAAFHAAADPAPVPAPLPFRTKDLLASARRAEELSRHVVLAAEEGDDELAEAVKTARGSGADLTQALVYACQNASNLAGTLPQRALALVVAVEREASLGASRRLRFEVALLRSQALLYLQRTAQAREAVDEARCLLPVPGGDPVFDTARVDYFDGSALGFDDRYEEALARLDAALRGFVGAGLDRWIGRAEAAIGVVLVQRNNDIRALDYFASAAERLEEEEDERAVTSLLLSEGCLLDHHKRYSDARLKFTEVLRRAVRARLDLSALDARYNLALVSLNEGRVREARTAFERIVPALESRKLETRLINCRLFVAECCVLLQDGEGTRAQIEALRPHADRADTPAYSDLFKGLDAGDLAAGEIRHVRNYLEALAQGDAQPYRSLRSA